MWPLKVPSIPNYSMILWSKCKNIVELSFYKAPHQPLALWTFPFLSEIALARGTQIVNGLLCMDTNISESLPGFLKRTVLLNTRAKPMKIFFRASGNALAQLLVSDAEHPRGVGAAVAAPRWQRRRCPLQSGDSDTQSRQAALPSLRCTPAAGSISDRVSHTASPLPGGRRGRFGSAAGLRSHETLPESCAQLRCPSVRGIHLVEKEGNENIGGWSTSPVRTAWDSWSCSGCNRRQGSGETLLQTLILEGGL